MYAMVLGVSLLEQFNLYPNYCSSVICCKCRENNGFADQSYLEILVLSLICDIGKLFQQYELIPTLEKYLPTVLL